MPVLSRMVCLFFVALVLHILEESRFPGGFTDLVTNKFHFTASDPHFGELVTASYAMIIAFVPLFFPRVTWLAMTAMILGILEFVVHTAAVKLSLSTEAFLLTGPSHSDSTDAADLHGLIRTSSPTLRL